MGLSKSTRIQILLGVDGAFFLLELIVGYAVHSLALVADAFHMLNDVLSLCVGLWAVKVASSSSSKTFTYGWQRAETLGALINGVFLVALCLTIFLEAIQRFVEPQEVSQPKLVLIVGCFGLASNILGLFLFHDHGHSHGGHAHSHGDEEEGHIHEPHAIDTDEEEARAVANESGNIADVLPQNRLAGWPQTNTAEQTSPSPSRRSVPEHSQGDEDSLTVAKTRTDSSATAFRSSSTRSPAKRHRRNTSGSRSRFASVDDIQVHPASFRNDIINASHLKDIESSPTTESEGETPAAEDDDEATEGSSLLKHKQKTYSTRDSNGAITKSLASVNSHANHYHRRPKAEKKGSVGHSHGDLNMRGVFLHVMGDALGNIGVIASALFIWLTDYWWRFYSDPLISLIITVIILVSAIPLCRAASRILLQAVPSAVNVDEVKADIEDLPGVVSCHHLHVWQLSDTKYVASLHVQVAFDYNGADSAQYMALAKSIRTCLHGFGIHSSTIQPEFCLDDDHRHVRAADHSNGGSVDGALKKGGASRDASIRSTPDACLLDCDDACGQGKGCCAPADISRDDDRHSH